MGWPPHEATAAGGRREGPHDGQDHREGPPQGPAQARARHGVGGVGRFHGRREKRDEGKISSRICWPNRYR
jgi:hypothetical protein